MPGPLLDRVQIEGRLRTAWAAQQRAERIGDSRSADKQRETIDKLLEQLMQQR
jgi:hypothetical protein